MRVNQSDGSKSNNDFLQQWSNSSQVVSPQPSLFTFGAKGKQNFNHYRRTQVIIAIALAVLTTLWVQITMQRHAPFIRTAQCYFNEVIFFHDSQDIYQGKDVIYWRNGQTHSYDEIKGIFTRLTDTLQKLEQVSMFRVPANYTRADTEDVDVDMLVIYRYDTPRRYEQVDTYNSSIEDMGEMLNRTLANRTFYQHLWKVELSISKPIIYREQIFDMQLFFSGQIYSSMLMQYKLDVMVVDELANDLKGEQQSYSQEQLGVRKLQNPHNLQMNSTYLRWVILVLYMGVSVLQYRFLLQKNILINQKIKQKLIEEHRIQELLQKIGDRINNNGSVVDSFIINMIEQREELGDNKDKRYTISLKKRIKKIGFYYVLELVVSILAFIGFYNDNNGLICFFAWLKLLIYLAQTKNRLMFGFLFEQALPIYLRVEVNILILMTAFVLFNMLVCTASNKFQTLELGYFEYLFNYFQYGIYENFKKAFEPFGMLAQFFYFCQIMLLLYVGNNILISILASQVSKTSMLLGVEEMLDEMRMQCPQCGTPFARKKGKAGEQEQYQKEKLVSKLMKDLEFEKSRLQSQMSSHDGNDQEDINIVIKSPTLSPYFPRKNQMKREEEQFMSPSLKSKTLQQRLRAIDLKLQKQSEKTTSKLEAYEELKIKVHPPKKTAQVQLAQSELHAESNQRYLKRVKTKNQLLFRAVEELRPEKIKKESIPSKNKNEVYSEVLGRILGKVTELQNEVKKSING